MNNVYIKWEYISRIVFQVAYFSHNCRIPMTNTALLCVHKQIFIQIIFDTNFCTTFLYVLLDSV